MQQRRWSTPILQCLKFCVAACSALLAGARRWPQAPSICDSEPRTLIVTEGGSKSELALAAAKPSSFCPNGCFVTLPNGDLEALTGSETIEISGGVARIK